MKKITFSLLAASGLLIAAAASAHAQAFVGLGSLGNTLSVFSAPGAVPNQYSVTGLTAGDSIVNIDYFTSGTGQLFGMGSSGTLYSLAQSGTNTYAATINISNGVPGATVIDFNPAAGRLRVYAGTSNYRITPTTGAFNSDGELAYAAGDVNSGAFPNLAAAAYTNNFVGSTATALYSIDYALDALILNTNGPAFSTLTTVATLTLGGVRFDVGSATTGFDITTLNGVNTAYVTSRNNLYTVDLATGVLTSLGQQRGTNIIDVTFTPVPEPGTYALLAAGALLLGFVVVRRRRQVAA